MPSKDINTQLNRRQRGEPFRDFEGRRNADKACVTYVDVEHYTANVVTNTGKHIADLPWPSVSGEISAPKVGDVFLISYDDELPRLTIKVHQAFDYEFSDDETHAIFPHLAPSKTRVHSQSLDAPNYRGNKPRDILPGDWVKMSDAGNLIAVLDGGVTCLKASSLAQIIASKTNDLLHLIGRNLNVSTDFGTIQAKNEGGRTSLVIKGGSQQSTESSPMDEHFTIECALGAEGDVLDFKVMDVSGKVKYQTHSDAAGNLRVHSNSVMDSTEENRNEVTGGKKNEVVVGDYSRHVNGSSKLDVAGVAETNATGGFSVRSVFGGVNFYSGRDTTITSGAKLIMKAAGDAIPTPRSVAAETIINNGSWNIDVGNPINGSIASANASMNVNVPGGDIDCSTRMGNILLKTFRPNSVLLGGSSKRYSAVKYEDLKRFLDQLGNFLDSHIHPTGVGPSGPPVAPPYNLSSWSLPLAKSRYVKLGG